MMPLRRLSLTDFKCTIPRAAREKTLKQALDKDGVFAKWEATAWGKKLKARKTRSEMNDFDRFKLMVARKKRSAAVKKSLKVEEVSRRYARTRENHEPSPDVADAPSRLWLMR